MPSLVWTVVAMWVLGAAGLIVGGLVAVAAVRDRKARNRTEEVGDYDPERRRRRAEFDPMRQVDIHNLGGAG
jgi:hypothetical protein